jgi:hypothetical protein
MSSLWGGLGAQSRTTPSRAGQELYTPRERFGVGVDRLYGSIANYDVSQLCAGWYTDWGTQLNPPLREQGIEFVQLVAVGPGLYNPDNPSAYNWNALRALVVANPGALWLIGNEPDGRAAACDTRTPDEYARVYHEFHTRIKSYDPTARLANGGIIQGSPLRILWLDKVWTAYRARYGTDMPVDVWNMHNQVVWENERNGAFWPAGLTQAEIDARKLGDDKRWPHGITSDDVDNPEVFRAFVENMRRWLRDKGQQERELIISEFGMMQPEYNYGQYWGYPTDRVNEYMRNTFTYLSAARDPALGMPQDDYRLVQRWAWFTLNSRPQPEATGWNGNLFDPDTRQLTVFGENYARLACAAVLPTPTPNTTPRSVQVWREAESGSLRAPMLRSEDPGASECTLIHLDDAVSGDTAAQALYNVFVPNQGLYALWGRVRGSAAEADYGYLKVWVDNDFSLFENEGWVDWKFTAPAWEWKALTSGGAVRRLDLTRNVPPGGRWCTIGIKPSGSLGQHARLDALVLMPWPGSAPTGTLSCQPTPTRTATRTVTTTPSPTPTAVVTTTATATVTPSRTATATLPYTPTVTTSPTPTEMPTPTPTATGAAIIVNIYSDANHNRVPDPGELPVPGALVRLADREGRELAQRASDANGQVIFWGLMEDSYYRLAVTPPWRFQHGSDGAVAVAVGLNQVRVSFGLDPTEMIALPLFYR